MPDILGGGTVGIVLRVGDVGDDLTHREGVGRISTQGGAQYNGVSTSAREGCCLGIPPAVGRDGGGGTEVGRDLRLPQP